MGGMGASGRTRGGHAIVPLGNGSRSDSRAHQVTTTTFRSTHLGSNSDDAPAGADPPAAFTTAVGSWSSTKSMNDNTRDSLSFSICSRHTHTREQHYGTAQSTNYNLD